MTSTSKPTMEQIATNRVLWEQYVDPQGNDPEAFDRMTVGEKIKLQAKLWPEEMDAEDSIQILAASGGLNDDEAIKKAVRHAINVLAAAVTLESEYGDPDLSLIHI